MKTTKPLRVKTARRAAKASTAAAEPQNDVNKLTEGGRDYLDQLQRQIQDGVDSFIRDPPDSQYLVDFLMQAARMHAYVRGLLGSGRAS